MIVSRPLSSSTANFELIEAATFTGTSKTFSGLDGNTDIGYFLRLKLAGGASASNISINFNGVTSGYTFNSNLNNGGSLSGSAGNGNQFSQVQPNSYVVGFMFISAVSGFPRQIHTFHTTTTTSGSVDSSTDRVIHWAELITNVTSIRLTFSASLATSRAELFRIR